MRRFGPIALAVVFAAGCSGRDGVRDAGDAVRGLVRVDLSYTHTAGMLPATPASTRRRASSATARSTPTASRPSSGSPTSTACRSTAAASSTAPPSSTPRSPPTTSRPPPRSRCSTPATSSCTARSTAPRSRRVHYPELVPFVSGVVYGGDELRPVALALGQPYLVTGEGGNEVGPFSAAVTAPRSFPTLSVDLLRRGSDLDVRWSTEGIVSNEPLMLEARWSSRIGGTRMVRCRVRDDGSFSIPHDAFTDLPAAAALSSATVTAARLARAPFFAPGAGRGDLTLALKDVAALQVDVAGLHRSVRERRPRRAGTFASTRGRRSSSPSPSATPPTRSKDTSSSTPGIYRSAAPSSAPTSCSKWARSCSSTSPCPTGGRFGPAARWCVWRAIRATT